MPSMFEETYPQKFWKAVPMFITRKSRERLSRGDYLVSRQLLSYLHFIVWHRQILKLCWKSISFPKKQTGYWWSSWTEVFIIYCFGTTSLLDWYTCINKAAYTLNISLYLIFLPLGSLIRFHHSAALSRL